MLKTVTKKVWTKFSEKFGTSITHPQFALLRFQREVIEEVKRYAKGKLVDIGCGRMPYRKELEPLIVSYTGVDHPEVSKLYSSELKPEVLADARKLPFSKNSFDTALLLHVLEHVDDPQMVIEEAGRILKPNGVLIISAPFLYPLHDMPYDWGRYTETALRSFIDDAGLRVVKIKKQGNFLVFWLQMLNTFLVKRINDILLHNFKLYSIAFLLILMPVALIITVFNNLLIIVISNASNVFPKYPNYFPLGYLLIARKKS